MINNGVKSGDGRNGAEVPSALCVVHIHVRNLCSVHEQCVAKESSYALCAAVCTKWTIEYSRSYINRIHSLNSIQFKLNDNRMPKQHSYIVPLN